MDTHTATDKSSATSAIQRQDGGDILAVCEDCNRPYGERGFHDLIIPNDAWRRISTNGDETGLLCPSCLLARLERAGISCDGALLSGPVRTVSPELMTTMRWVENLREQGHGWNCPKCGEWRDRS